MWTLTQSPSQRPAINVARAGITVLSACVLHALVGATLAGIAILCLVWLYVRWPGERRAALAVAGGVALGAALALPYWVLCVGARSTSGLRWGPNPDMAWTWLVAGGALALLAVLEWVQWRKEERRSFARTASIFVATAVLALGCLLTIFPHNETKLFQLGVLLFAIPAAGSWERALGNRWRLAAWAGLIGLGVPTVALATIGFLNESGADSQGSLRPSTHEIEAYQWLATHSHGSAGVICNSIDDSGQVDRDVLVHGRRGLIWGGPQYARVWGYDVVELDLRPLRRLRRGRALAERRADVTADSARPREDRRDLLARAQVAAIRPK